jgi:DNA polymerase I
VIYLIDASVYVFRAYYSMPPDMMDRDGHPAHATFGFARFLGDLVERAQPRYMAVAFDESLSTSFRNQIYPAYKANRDPPPEDLKLQFERCRDASSVTTPASRRSVMPITKPTTSSAR